jgi:hypothetical protein
VARIEIEPDWEEHVDACMDVYFIADLGPEIATRAKRYCPKRTGALADSIENHLEGHNLIVSATGSGEKHYAAFVELGHRVFHPSTHSTGPDVVPPEPFLRPALYGIDVPVQAGNRALYSEAHAQAEHLRAGYREHPHAQPAHLTPLGYNEEPIAINMAAALLRESPSAAVALREAAQFAHRARTGYGAHHQVTLRAERAVTYIKRITRPYGG